MYQYIKSDYEILEKVIQEHMQYLRFPLDSYMEETLFKSQLSGIYKDDVLVGYFGLEDQTLNFFYVKASALYSSASTFEEIVKLYNIEKVIVLTSDQTMNVILVEWNFEKKRMGCFFTDSKREIKARHKLEQPVLRIAKVNEIDAILDICGDFFDEEGGGFKTLEERVEAETIFILGYKEAVYGCGIIEKGRVCNGYASIGMFTNPEYRKCGVARMILLGLKKHVYKQGLEPIAGCWYYNTLSKASLESAGMVASSMAYFAELIDKDKPPKRTGNPPGELVE